jgi:hypothetical protein
MAKDLRKFSTSWKRFPGRRTYVPPWSCQGRRGPCVAAGGPQTGGAGPRCRDPFGPRKDNARPTEQTGCEGEHGPGTKPGVLPGAGELTPGDPPGRPLAGVPGMSPAPAARRVGPRRRCQVGAFSGAGAVGHVNVGRTSVPEHAGWAPGDAGYSARR